MPIRVFLGIAGLLLSAPAFAYIDPGTGSAIVSAIIALFVGIAVAIKGYWYKLKAMALRLLKPASAPAAEVADPGQNQTAKAPSQE
jgi:hypothetical protein